MKKSQNMPVCWLSSNRELAGPEFFLHRMIVEGGEGDNKALHFS
jgi:hypothetical protein